MKRKGVLKASFDIVVVGAGYVGLVAGACFADLGFKVCVIDRNPDKVRKLLKGIVPFYEPGLEAIVLKNIKKRNLFFASSLAKVVDKTSIIMIAVGTPSLPNGRVHMHDYWNVIDEISAYAKGFLTVVNKSTVPVGTARRAARKIKLASHHPVDIVSFPEFLREGTALQDFLHPDRLVIGTSNVRAERLMKRLLRNIRTTKLFTSVETAEMIKYASNAFLATKISFINEIANICESVGADVTEVAKGMGLDKRIGKSFLQAGIGYGGSCFPKDVKALKFIAGSNHYTFKLLKSVIEVNSFQRKYFVEKIEKNLHGVRGKTLAVLGLAFKPHTDDVRESAAIDIVKQLLKKGASIVAYDPEAHENARIVLKDAKNIHYCSSIEKAASDADAVVVATEWPEFQNADWQKIKKLLKTPIVFDGRNILSPRNMISYGYSYYAMGR